MSLLEAGRHFNVEIRIYNFCQFTILTLILSCWLINLGVFLTKKKKTIANFLNPLNIYRLAFVLRGFSIFWVKINNFHLL